MKATHSFADSGSKGTYVTVKFIVTSSHIETAILELLDEGETPTVKSVKDKLRFILWSLGIGAVERHECLEGDFDEAEKIGRKLFPSFY